MFFASSGGPVLSELGYKGAWLKIRERAHVANRGNGSCVWEYSKGSLPHSMQSSTVLTRHSFASGHGFSQGVNAARMDIAAACC